MSVKFSVEHVSDQKRLARGEHLLFARTQLRTRDEVHNAKWRVMIMAGGNPAGEIGAIRELMPRAHIVAVDRDASCLAAAREAGANETIEVDLTDYAIKSNASRPATALAELPRFDLVNLDLCAGANSATKKLIAVYRSLITAGGVFNVTFSYGRDVAELFESTLTELRAERDGCIECRDRSSHAERLVSAIAKIETSGMPDNMAGRLCYLFSPSLLDRIQSVIGYSGNAMPMCSVVIVVAGYTARSLRFIQLAQGDLELAATYPDTANLYDCPADRILAFRRSFAARLASANRRGAAGAISSRKARPNWKEELLSGRG